jgi:hypothetical protein
VLIKAVAQAIPTYTVSFFLFFFLLPRGWCDELNALLAKYWWGAKGASRKIHWTKWSLLCKPKEDGGLGFRDLAAFNKALLAKQGWRLLTNSHSLFYRTFKSKYFPNGTFLSAKVGSNSSFVWRSFLATRDLLLDGVRWEIGNGLSVDVWHDTWSERPLVRGRDITGVQQVADLLDSTRGTWDMEIVDRVFNVQSVTKGKQIPLPMGLLGDRMGWSYEKHGEFSVRSAYGAAVQLGSVSPLDESSTSSLHRGFWHQLWKSKTPEQIETSNLESVS